jgi:hypothetical protein
MMGRNGTILSVGTLEGKQFTASQPRTKADYGAPRSRVLIPLDGGDFASWGLIATECAFGSLWMAGPRENASV